MSNLFQTANQLRKRQTTAERMLWDKLRNRKLLNAKFRRQAPIIISNGSFIPDFCSKKEKIVIEVDGGIHDNPYIKEHDDLKENFLEKEGYKILRFSNDEVQYSIKNVLEKIEQAIIGRREDLTKWR